MATTTKRFQPGEKIGGRYTVREVHVGGMGEVYLCVDSANKPVALKTFRSRFWNNQKTRDAFNREVSTWIALGKHPNIVQCNVMNVIDNRPFMFLEWVTGPMGYRPSLQQWLRRGPLDLKDALEFTMDVCRGLIYAQEIHPGLVHRDLKPSNILIDSNRYAKITDFGLAKIVEEVDPGQPNPVGQLPLHTQGAGTPLYMAPEQWTGDAIDQRTDIYAIGCILYEMIAGIAAFDVTNPSNTSQPPQLTAPIPRLPDDLGLNPILEGCLAQSPLNRYASVQDLRAELIALYQMYFQQRPREPIVSYENTAADYHNRGLTYLHLGQNEEALEELNRAIQLDPTSGFFYVNRGICFHNLRQYKKTEADYIKAIEVDPRNARAYSNYSLLLSERGNPQEALSKSIKAIGLSPRDFFGYHSRAAAYEGVRRYKKALDDYDKAIKLNPMDAFSYTNRGRLLEHKLKNKTDALRDYQKAIELDPLNIKHYVNRASIYLKTGQMDKAINDYSHIIELDSNESWGYCLRGRAYARLQRSEDSVRDLNHAVDLTPQSPVFYFWRGVMHAKALRLISAFSDLIRFATRVPRKYWLELPIYLIIKLLLLFSFLKPLATLVMNVIVYGLVIPYGVLYLLWKLVLRTWRILLWIVIFILVVSLIHSLSSNHKQNQEVQATQAESFFAFMCSGDSSSNGIFDDMCATRKASTPVP